MVKYRMTHKFIFYDASHHPMHYASYKNSLNNNTSILLKGITKKNAAICDFSTVYQCLTFRKEIGM